MRAKHVLPALLLILLVPAASRASDVQGDWRRLGPEGGSVFDLAAAPSDPRILYALVEGRVFKSADAGASWTDIQPRLRLHPAPPLGEAPALQEPRRGLSWQPAEGGDLQKAFWIIRSFATTPQNPKLDPGRVAPSRSGDSTPYRSPALRARLRISPPSLP